jgi:hypothetical protein
MPLTYTDVINSVFGARKFTAKELARSTGNPRAAKVLSELKQRGVVERIGRGTYRCLPSGARPELRNAESDRVRGIVLAGPDPKAWAGTTALELWTGGRYRIGTSVFSHVLELAIPRNRVGEWGRYLSARRVCTDTRKRIGTRVRLAPRTTVSPTYLNGQPVVPRKEVERLIRDHPALYASAKELLFA